jgi:hypothetical protein
MIGCQGKNGEHFYTIERKITAAPYSEHVCLDR